MDSLKIELLEQKAKTQSQKDSLQLCQETLKSSGITIFAGGFASFFALLIIANSNKNWEIIIWGAIFLLNMASLFYVFTRIISMNRQMDKLKQELEEDIREIRKL